MSVYDLNWTDDAACRSRMDLPWLAEPEDVGLFEEARMARVCDTCPVRAACATFADLADITGGFWAGHHRTPDGPLLTWTGDAA